MKGKTFPSPRDRLAVGKRSLWGRWAQCQRCSGLARRRLTWPGVAPLLRPHALRRWQPLHPRQPWRSGNCRGASLSRTRSRNPRPAVKCRSASSMRCACRKPAKCSPLERTERGSVEDRAGKGGCRGCADPCVYVQKFAWLLAGRLTRHYCAKMEPCTLSARECTAD